MWAGSTRRHSVCIWLPLSLMLLEEVVITPKSPAACVVAPEDWAAGASLHSQLLGLGLSKPCLCSLNPLLNALAALLLVSRCAIEGVEAGGKSRRPHCCAAPPAAYKDPESIDFRYYCYLAFASFSRLRGAAHYKAHMSLLFLD